jgi:HD-like signal output (HDOD) protein
MNIPHKQEIEQKIKKGAPFNFKFKFASKDNIMFINTIMAKLLANMDRIFLLNSIVTILREVVVNAQKANAKRIYFRMKDIDIRNAVSYDKGMVDFKENVIGDLPQFEEKILQSDYYINLNFTFEGDDLHVVISNNAPILPKELERVNHRIDKAIEYNDFSEAYAETEDDTEGAGLGIVLTILFLKSMGIDPKTFTLTSDAKETTTTLFIPKQLRPPTITTTVRDKIIEDVQGIPTFPENIIQLQKLCNDPESSIELISRKIQLDPALSADVIKLSNSAGFVPGKRIESVYDAVMTIGLKNVNAILTASNARKILNERYAKYEEIWEHCNKVAFYSRSIAGKLKNRQVLDNSFLTGLLHDLGKIIILSTNKALVNQIADQVKERKIKTSTILEEISIGISHSSIGELVARKWNFPEYLVESIQHHHAPLSASHDNRDIVFVAYLANMLVGIEDRKYYYYYLENEVLERFGIDSEEKFNQFHKNIKNKFEVSAAFEG